MPIFEVFAQEQPDQPDVHCGSVEAADLDLACQYARAMFARREEACRLWVVPRAWIREVRDPDLLRPPGDHRYRMAKSYRVTVDKRKRLRARYRKGDTP
jgi:phenylacetate-CoA oxygenase PaaH subunit